MGAGQTDGEMDGKCVCRHTSSCVSLPRDCTFSLHLPQSLVLSLNLAFPERWCGEDSGDGSDYPNDDRDCRLLGFG